MSGSEGLQAGAQALGLTLGTVQLQGLLDYLQLIAKWNRVYNLTAIRDVDAMVSHHLLDSLSVVPHLPGESLIDVGSGPGLPGVPIALMLPARRVVLLEANQKKAAFLRQVTIELSLLNVEVIASRAELYREKTFDAVISRAFAELSAFIRAAGHLAHEGGSLLAMKGVYPSEEVREIPAGWITRSTVPLMVPGLNAERHLIQMVRT